MNSIQAHDALYKERGLMAQRLYPNEEIIRLIAANYLRLPYTERAKVRILEVGCGTGANLWMLAKEGFSTYGVDSSITAIELARAHLYEKWGLAAHMCVGLFDRLPFPDTYFDSICDVVSLQHTTLEGSRRAFAEVWRCLKSRGLFFSFRLSDASTMYQRSAGNWLDAATVDNIADETMPLNNNGTTSFWSPALARMMYAAQGFRLTSVERSGRTYDGGTRYVEYLTLVAAKP